MCFILTADQVKGGSWPWAKEGCCAAQVSFKTACLWEAELTDSSSCLPLSPRTSPFPPVWEFPLGEILVGDFPSSAQNFLRITWQPEALIQCFPLLPSQMSEGFSDTQVTQAVSHTTNGSVNEHLSGNYE